MTIAMRAALRRVAFGAVWGPLLLAGLASFAGCSSPAFNCPRAVEMTIPVSPELPDAAADGGLGNDLVLCLADLSGCQPLCEKALPVAPNSVRLDQCQLVHVDGGFAVHVIYTPYCPG